MRKRRTRQSSQSMQFPDSKISRKSKKDQKINFDEKKKSLIENLQIQISKLSIVSEKQETFDDAVILELQKIIEEAKIFEFREISKMGELTIGKRIINIELNRKKVEAANKMSKKRQIEDLFRQNRVNKLNYEELAKKKIEQNSFIVKPYCNGRGFLQNDYFYEKVISPQTGHKYTKVFLNSNYSQVIKRVNSIFFNNFSNYSSTKSQKQALSHPIVKMIFFFTLVLFFMCLVASFKFISGLNIAIFVVSILIVIGTLGISLRAFCEDIRFTGPLDQTICEVKAEFEKINFENQLNNIPYQWECPDNFMYLELKVDSSVNIIDPPKKTHKMARNRNQQ